MLEKGKISARQMTILVTIYCLGSAILFIPTVLAAEAKQDLWISALIGMGAGALLIYCFRALGERFPDHDLFSYSEILFGKWVGKAVSLVFFVYFYFLTAVLLRDIGDFITTQVLTDTPIQFTEVLFLLVVVMAVRLGLEVIAHAAELFFPWILLMFGIMIIFLIPQVKFENLLPIYEGGLKPIFSGAFQFFLFPFLETVAFLVLYPYVKRVPKARNAHLVGAMLAGVALIILSLLALLVMGVDLTTRNMYVTYTLAKRINIGHFLERVEAIMATIWLMTIFFKMAILFYVSTLGLAHILRLKEYRSLILPLGMLLVLLSIKITPNIVYFLTDFAKAWSPFAFLVGCLMPLMMLAVAMFRFRNKSPKSDTSITPDSADSQPESV